MRQVDPHLLGYTCFSFVGFVFTKHLFHVFVFVVCVCHGDHSPRAACILTKAAYDTSCQPRHNLASCAQHIFCSASCSAVAAHRPPCSASCSAVIFLCREASPAHTRDCALSRAQMTQRLPQYLCWSAHMCNTALLLYIACAILLRDSGVLLLLPPTRRNRAIPLDVSLPCRADRRPNGG